MRAIVFNSELNWINKDLLKQPGDQLHQLMCLEIGNVCVASADERQCDEEQNWMISVEEEWNKVVMSTHASPSGGETCVSFILFFNGLCNLQKIQIETKVIFELNQQLKVCNNS